MLLRLFRPSLIIFGLMILMLTASTAWFRESINEAMVVSSNFRDYDQALYLVSPDGVPLQRLTTIPGAEQFISAAADGEWIIVQSLVNRRYYSVNVVTGHVYPIWKDHEVDVYGWLPTQDALLIRAYDLSFPNYPVALYLMQPNGQVGQQISGSLHTVNVLDWSPDGEWLYFVALASDGQHNLLYRVRTDGTGLELVAGESQFFIAGTWSADGRWLYYSARRNLQTDIYRLNVETLIEVQLTTLADKDYVIGWSPDGEWLYFQNHHHPTQSVSVYQMRADGTDQQILFTQQSLSINFMTAVAADTQNLVLFEARRSAGNSQFTFDTANNLVHEIAQGSRWFIGFSSEDGWGIFGEGAREPLHSRLMMVNFEDGRIRNITPTNIETLFRAEVSPDGSRIYAEAFIGDDKVIGVVDMETRRLNPVHRTYSHNNQQQALVGWVDYGHDTLTAWSLMGLSMATLIFSVGGKPIVQKVRLHFRK